MTKGIILAGGSATRLYPATKSISKHLLPVYDKPMIYYPLACLMLAGIREILIISTSSALPLYKTLLEDGDHFGIKIEYAVQEKPRGLAEAFIIAEDFIGHSSVCLILGDNIFYGQGLLKELRDAAAITHGAKIFGYYVKNPQRYGVAEVDMQSKKVLSIEEKPKNPRSNYAIPGLYFCDNTVIDKAKKAIPSERGELEITSVLQSYLDQKQLEINLLGRGIAWFDTGTHDSLLEASNFIAAIENRQGLKIACLEEVAYNCGYIDAEHMINVANKMPNVTYAQYIKNLIK
jgi:glucose-1-phosphate thymidylyltransferase